MHAQIAVILKQVPGPHVNCVVFSPDGTTLAVANKQVELWDVAQHKKISTLNGHVKQVTSILYLPRINQLVSADWSGIHFWDMDTRKQASVIPRDGWITSLAVSPDERTLMVGTASTLETWDIDSKLQVGPSLLTTDCWSIAYSPLGKSLAFSSGSKVEVWRTKPFAVKKLLDQHRKRIWCVAFSGDGKSLASGSDDFAIKIWNMKSYKEVCHIGHAHASGVYCVCFSPDGEILASGGADGTVKLWKRASGEILGTLPMAPVSSKAQRSPVRVKSISFSPDGTKLAVGGYNPAFLQLWTLESSNTKT